MAPLNGHGRARCAGRRRVVITAIGEVERLTISHARYEKLRKMNVPQFAELFQANTSSGIPFDELLDKWCGRHPA